MDKPTPPKTITTRMLGTGPEVEFVFLTDAIAHGEAMAAWGAAQYKEDAERYRWLREQEGWPESEAAMSGISPIDFDSVIDKARKS